MLQHEPVADRDARPDDGIVRSGDLNEARQYRGELAPLA
jgi:hypothetical protein